MPSELMLYRHLGDSRMLVAGGLLDQPVQLWLTVQYAGWVDQLLRKQANPNTKPEQYSQIETEFLLDVIQPLRMQLALENPERGVITEYGGY